MSSTENISPNDEKFEGWQEEFNCEECRKWTGKPPVPIAKATEMLEARGFRNFRLVHACHLRVGSDGRQHHIPSTILELPDGSKMHWIPELL